MVTKAQQAGIESYGKIMVEVKSRISAIDTLLQGQTRLPNDRAVESCFLQLRMISELVALGCLIAHGDITETQSSRFQKEYSSDRILSRLESLHTEFFPIPMGTSETSTAGRHHHFGLPPADAMS